MDLKVALILATAFVYSATRSVQEEVEYKKDLQFLDELLKNVPENDRRQFLIHQLYLGYVMTHPNDLIIPVSTNVTLKLYEMFLTNFLKNPVDHVLLATVCFPSGECVDTDDPGVIP